MPVIPTSNPDLTGLKGIHLWHAGLSTCSQRVRIALAELGPPLSSDRVRDFQCNHRNEQLKAFHREFHAGFARSRVTKAAAATDRDFRVLEESLSGRRESLAGPAFSLADIAWTPNFHRFDLIGWPFERYPKLQRWFQRISSRASYDAALQSWEPRELLDTAAPRLKARQASGDGIESYFA